MLKKLPNEFQAQLRKCLISNRPLRRFTFIGDLSEEPKRDFGPFDERRLIFKEPQEFFNFESEFCFGKNLIQTDLIENDADMISNIKEENN